MVDVKVMARLRRKLKSKMIQWKRVFLLLFVIRKISQGLASQPKALEIDSLARSESRQPAVSRTIAAIEAAARQV
jgi:hypothetical protein